VTLSIGVHRFDPNSGELGPDLIVEPGAALAGFEIWRTSVYGSASVRQRGARFLPQLATGDLLIEGADLFAFQEECAFILRNVVEVASDVGVDVETLRFRLSNMVAAADQAISIGGAVWIS